MKLFLLILIGAAFFSGCTPKSTPPLAAVARQAPAEFPESYYREAIAAGHTVFHVNSALSLVTIEVRRAGALARLGHDHVVASHGVHGYVDLTNGRADLLVALAQLVVDEQELRTEAGLNSILSIEAIEGTRRNMLEKVLDAERYPFALISVTRRPADSSMLQVTITLHGASKTWEVPVQIENLANGIRISGQMAFNQSDFGITPFSILGGAIQVQDTLNLRFKIYANRNL